MVTAVFAHRGSGPSGPEKENTVGAFMAAQRLGADGIELDVRRTADRHLVVHHDVELPTGVLICTVNAADLPSDIPSLAEALDACGEMAVNVEVKNVKVDPDFDPSQWVARESAFLLVGRGALERERDQVVVSCFSRRALQAVKSSAPGLSTAWLVGMNLRAVDVLTIAAADGFDGIHPYVELVDAHLVEAAHAASLAVRVWTVNEPDRIAELALLGVDAIVTNDVALARRAISRAQLATDPSSREQSGP